MSWFRLFLLATGLVVFLALRHFAGPETATPDPNGFPATPNPAPADFPEPQLPFPQTPPQSAFA